MRKPGHSVFASMLVSLLVVGAASAADDPRAEALADACTSCHGIAGRSHGYIPSINALSRAQFIQALQEYRAQKRTATIMNRVTKAYTPAEIALLADYFTSGTVR